jgi:hypothetical protein
MAANSAVTLYAVIVALPAFALGFVALWSRRDLRMRLVAIALSLAMVPAAWFAFSQLPGKPNDITAEEFREQYQCTSVLHAQIRERVGILMLAQRRRMREPEFIFVSWNMRLASSLQKSMRVAKLNGKGTIIYGRASCKNSDSDGDDDGTGTGKGKSKSGKGHGLPSIQEPGSSGREQDGKDGFTFSPDPVPPTPEKNYGPLYEGPIEMPRR